MLSNPVWLASLSPMCIAAAALCPAGLRRGRIRYAGLTRFRLATMIALGVAVLAALLVAAKGTLATGTVGAAGLGAGLYLDALTVTMFVLVAFVGAVVVNFSHNYLDGDPGQTRFLQLLCLTLAAVLLLIISGNLLQFWLAFVATSLLLNQLLIFYRDRPAARLAARKKFLVSRLAEICLAAAFCLIYSAIGSADFAAIFDGVGKIVVSGKVPAPLYTAAALLVVAALLKSAQFPLHGWLIEVMETPTPVSALLHAGIINAGGFVVLRFVHVIALSPASLDVLAVIGGLTAMFGSIVMLTQTSIKVSLAYSTIAQMGFMMLECGLGAYGAALLHIVAHSLYKAHAFLSSGSVIELSRAAWTPNSGESPHPARLVIAVILAVCIAVAVGSIFGASMVGRPGAVVLSAVLLMGLVNLLANSLDEGLDFIVICRSLLLAVFVASASFALQRLAEVVLGGLIPPARPFANFSDAIIPAGVAISFGALTIFQILLPHRAGQPRWQTFYTHVSNGLYVNTLANRWVLRLWPAISESSARQSSNITISKGART
jgi:NAD(P)H-quinone oxidoreductase subunit 5